MIKVPYTNAIFTSTATINRAVILTTTPKTRNTYTKRKEMIYKITYGSF